MAEAPGPVATALKTQPSDLTALARRNRGMFPRTDVISFVIGYAPTTAVARPWRYAGLGAHLPGAGDTPILW